MKKRWPKYIILPMALLIYSIAMTVFGIHRNNGKLPDDFWLFLVVEVAVIIALYYLLKKKHNMR